MFASGIWRGGYYPAARRSTTTGRCGSYPFITELYTVTNGQPRGNTKHLIDWILSPRGQEIVEKTGYVPIA
ncbi:MAG: hypothetical protein LBH17_07585 [Oscillospiraceae bacterium]|nr:hypothetical protein [Oscillospiraceae bacterium]